MKQKLLMMLAALMLMGTSAMAQSETLKGDVNGDGAVDVADIAAEIAVMHQSSGKYYWYVGYDNEDWYTNRDAITTSKLFLTTTNSMPTIWRSNSESIYSIPGTPGTYIVVIVPEDWELPTLVNIDGFVGLVDQATVTIEGKSYKIAWSAGVASMKGIFIN